MISEDIIAELKILPDGWFDPRYLTTIDSPELRCERLIELGYLEVKTAEKSEPKALFCRKQPYEDLTTNPFIEYDPVNGISRSAKSANERVQMVEGFDLSTLRMIMMGLVEVTLQKSVRNRVQQRLDEWPRDANGDFW